MRREEAGAPEECRQTLERAYARFFRPSPARDSTEVLVCHGNVIRYLVTRAMGVDPRAWLAMSVGHASLTVIRIDPQGTMKILAVGDVGHIPPNMQSGTGADDPVLMVPAAPQDP